MKKLMTLAVMGALLLTSCVKGFDGMEPEPTTEPTPAVKIPNSFDFSTVQKVKLNVDYSAIKTYGSVFFGVYTQNPFVTVEDAPDDSWNESVTPIFEDYTDANGKYSATVELPTYAQHLYIATGNFFTGMLLMEIDVKNGSLGVVCENTEKFYMSNILIERQPIQDSEGKEIFIIDNFESTNEFACDISINSPSINSSNGTTDRESTDQTPNKFYFNRKNSSGLTGGAIAGIVIAIVVVLLATSVLIILGKKGVLSSKKDLDNKREYNSSNFILRAEDMMK